MTIDVEHDLLTPANWPQAVTGSPNSSVLLRAVRLASTLEESEAGDDDIDAELQYLFTRFSRLLPWMPDPEAGRPVYTRHVWDLRALRAVIPASFQLDLKQVTAVDKDGSARWRASLYDPSHTQNLALHDHSDSLGSAWSPNLALARLLIAGCIAAVIGKTLHAHAPTAAARQAA